MTAVRLPRACWLLLAVHLALTAGLALFNPHTHWLDDGYYSLTVARNLAHGDGFSYGGVPTNGVQPLYAFIMAPVFWVLGDAPERCLKIALLLMALSSAALLGVLMALARRLAGDTAAVAAGVFYVANANLLRRVLSGLEAPLHGLLFWLCVWLYWRIREKGSWRAQVGLGLLLGVTAYARLDTVFLFVGIALDIAWQHRRRWGEMVRRGTAVFAPALALLAPWFIWSKLACGSFFQVSGAFHRWRGLVRQDVPDSLLSWVKFVAMKWISLAIKLPLESLFGYEGIAGALAETERTESGFIVYLLRNKPALTVGMLALGLAIVLGLAWFGRARLRNLAVLRPFGFLVPALLGAAVFYPFYLLNYSMRHFFPYSVAFALGWGVLFATWPQDTRRARAIFAATAVIIAVSLSLPGWRFWRTDATPRAVFELVSTIRQTLPAGARLGYTDCGQFGYYLPDYTVVNLDGILNADALAAMRDGDIGAYLVQARVPYVLYLHNFKAEFAVQWQQFIAPRVEPVPPTDWVYRLKTGA